VIYGLGRPYPRSNGRHDREVGVAVPQTAAEALEFASCRAVEHVG
jgi:hypothetical protein